MQRSSDGHELKLPESLRKQLLDFRQHLWMIKLAEGVCGAVIGLLSAFLALFILDRLADTPPFVRWTIFSVALLACALLPIAIHRWVWRRRRLEQLARLLGKRFPSFGDQILGVIELVRSESEQARSRALCEAAIGQVAEQAQSKDFLSAVPQPRHIRRAMLATAAIVIGIGLGLAYPAAAANAWSRLLLPWKATPRYTFAKIVELPDRMVVPHGEPFVLEIELAEDTESYPSQATARLAGRQIAQGELHSGSYRLEIPAQISTQNFDLAIGDYSERIEIEPMIRPELKALSGEIELPSYLQRPSAISRDVRSGTVSLVDGSKLTLTATATRDLAGAEFNGVHVSPQAATARSRPVVVAKDQEMEIEWEDEWGLSGRQPFRLLIQGHEDGPPTVSCGDLPRQAVVLDSEQLTFHVLAEDDFGVREVGLEWRGVDDGALGSGALSSVAAGTRILAAGGPEQTQLELTGTFSAAALQIEPQPIELRIFATDYYPDREPAYSSPYLLYVLNAEQHAIWLTEQLNKWHRQSLDVRDRELQLYETNRELRALAPSELDQPEMRQQLGRQAGAERANGRRLSGLVQNGEQLVQQAMRNAEFGVGQLESWAEMLQVLKDISANRMPSVADLLTEAARASASSGQASRRAGPQVGQIRALPAAGNTAPDEPSDDEPDSEQPQVPSIADVESTMQPPSPSEDSNKVASSTPSSPRLTLPSTTLLGAGKEPEEEASPAEEKLEEAVAVQQDLLSEFERIAEELNRLLANLEGSTLVKRLKAASRRQYQIAGRLAEQIETTFGVPPSATPEAGRELLRELSDEELASSQRVSHIMDDIQAYFERRRFLHFKTVLDEMREQDVVGSLRQIAEEMGKRSGLSMAQCEYWSDTLDRWAEDLVEPSSGGKQSEGSKSSGSLPPALVLEALQILEAEMNLREETRVAEQAKPAQELADYVQDASALEKTQDEIAVRVDELVGNIEALPNGDEFGRELQLLSGVSEVMHEAVGILSRPETGAPAIAAETEAIEMLLQSKRINPKGGGGGGGSQPGGGGKGTTSASAMSLVGSGINPKEVKEDHEISQSTGETGRVLPEEFRAGLDQYFNRLEESEPRP